MNLHFVVSPEYSKFLEVLPFQKLGVDYPYWIGGRYNWAAQSYLMLREMRTGVTIGMTPKKGVMNFAHCMTWRTMGARNGEYRISARADYPRLFDVDFEILQNPLMPRAPRQAYLPYWPVPGILPRNSSREGVTTVAYAGRIGKRNLVGELDELFVRMQRVQFVKIQPHCWHDMSNIDLLIAVRDFSGKSHDDKPPSKLFNAWLANIPLIGGADSAFSAIGRPGVDYVRVSSVDQFLAALKQLIDDKSYYNSIATAGRERFFEVNHEVIAKQWLVTIDGTVQEDFERWREKKSVRPHLTGAKMLDEGRDIISKLKKIALRQN